ncbi:MAG TPA: hypothetical protein VFQ65_22365 [Kofleriaceae bacterium]|nr:hypothetical protein [Kofleriaceae bacterium]
MSLRLGCLVLGLSAAGLAFAAGCAGSAAEENEPQTAREKQYAEAKKNGELDEQKPVKKGGWQFKGDRKDCRYLVAATSKCFKTQKAACTAAGCGASCAFTGAGPATVSCKK